MDKLDYTYRLHREIDRLRLCNTAGNFDFMTSAQSPLKQLQQATSWRKEVELMRRTMSSRTNMDRHLQETLDHMRSVQSPLKQLQQAASWRKEVELMRNTMSSRTNMDRHLRFIDSVTLLQDDFLNTFSSLDKATRDLHGINRAIVDLPIDHSRALVKKNWRVERKNGLDLVSEPIAVPPSLPGKRKNNTVSAVVKYFKKHHVGLVSIGLPFMLRMCDSNMAEPHIFKFNNYHFDVEEIVEHIFYFILKWLDIYNLNPDIATDIALKIMV